MRSRSSRTNPESSVRTTSGESELPVDPTPRARYTGSSDFTDLIRTALSARHRPCGGPDVPLVLSRMAAPVPYPHLPGNAADALRTYQRIFGGELQLFTYGEFQRADGDAQLIAHGSCAGPLTSALPTSRLANPRCLSPGYSSRCSVVPTPPPRSAGSMPSPPKDSTRFRNDPGATTTGRFATPTASRGSSATRRPPETLCSGGYRVDCGDRQRFGREVLTGSS